MPPGEGSKKNLPKAVQLWDFAAKGGYATAQFNLGLLYYRGDGVAKSYPTAAAWFLKAAQGGSDDGAYAVAEMYRLGRGVPKDAKKAIFWFSQSAKNGNSAAADRLAVLGAPAVAPAPAQTASVAAVAAPAPAAVAPPPAAVSAGACGALGQRPGRRHEHEPGGAQSPGTQRGALQRGDRDAAPPASHHLRARRPSR